MQICSGAWHYLPCLLLDLASLQIANLAVTGAVLALRHEVLEDCLDLVQTLVVDFEAVIQKEEGPAGVEGASRHANAGTQCEFVSVRTFLQFRFDLLAHAVLGENPFSVVRENPVTLWQLVVDADVAQLQTEQAERWDFVNAVGRQVVLTATSAYLDPITHHAL